ncbi:hypothetical protein [Flavobacterium sp. B183]|uniref:hypothetical protein n=1 Tax=Flavobacterium sp. B183 TaxID=907046 RepID=UPI00201EA170|nr:hypothetical protein [Flavobacterium sp. B183]URC12544.1 hypothetical protein M4I44_21050 [Flavobacterium sp. B183]
MALQTLNTIKSWFKTGLKPTQTQFWDTWDSFRHKDEKVPVKDVEGIDKLLTGSKIVPSEGFIIFKVNPNTADELEIGDSVIGYCEGNFLSEATYYGGDTSLMSSFTKSNNIVGRILSYNTNDHTMTYELNNEVFLRSHSHGVYDGITLKYKRPKELEFSNGMFHGTYPQSWLGLDSGTIIKLIDTTGSLEDSEEFILPYFEDRE